MVDEGLVGRILIILLQAVGVYQGPVGSILKYVRINPTWLVFLVNLKIINVKTILKVNFKRGKKKGSPIGDQTSINS